MRTLLLVLSLLSLKCLAAPKVIALAPHVVENLYAIGAGEQILATTEHADYPAAAGKLPRVGNYARLQIEKIVALQPDYVIAWRGGNPPDDLARLEQLGLKVVDSAPKQLADVAAELRKLGKLMGKEIKAEKQARAFEYALAELRQTYGNKIKLKVFYELWPQPLTTVAKGSWPQQVLELCGAENVFASLKGEYPMISKESVLSAMPDVIIQPYDSARSLPETDWSGWPMLPAIKNGAVIHPNADKLHRMTSRMVAEAKALCQQIDLLRKQ